MHKIAGTLSDELLAATYQEKRVDNPFLSSQRNNRKFALDIRAQLLSAECYILEDDVVEAATELGIQHPDILMAMLPKARLPFRKTWIEWSNKTQLEAQGQEIAEDASGTIGAYIEQISPPSETPVYKITEMGFDYSQGIPMLVTHATQIVYTLDGDILDYVPFLHQERSSLARISDVSKEIMDAALLGSTYHRVARIGDDPDMRQHQLTICRKLAACASYTKSDMWPSYEQIHGASGRQFSAYTYVLKQSIMESSGLWRFLMSALAIMRTREYVDDTPVSRQKTKRRFVHGKSVPFLQHTRVKLKVPRKTVIRDSITSVREYVPQPLRRIEGYWRRRRRTADTILCNENEHVDVAETPNRFRCALCHSALFFTPDHDRGSVEFGMVKTDRVVTTR